MPNCKQCKSQFEVTDSDRRFYETMDVAEPMFCPPCRQQRRLMWRNERNFYRRKCDLCGKEHISIYSEDKPFKAYCQECWWSDKWNTLDYGREYDFSRTFFEQYRELQMHGKYPVYWTRSMQNCIISL